MELGGNIELIGFDSLDKAHQIVSKKIIGNLVKQIQDNHKDYKEITLNLILIGTADTKSFKIKGVLRTNNIKELNGEDKNLFQAISNSFNFLIEQTQ
jgi:hypothetical protein